MKRTLPDGSKLQIKKRVQPRRLHVKGESRGQKAYQDCLRWWRAAFKAGVSVPLAPQVAFPDPGDPGCAFILSDAAGERGTGYGGFSFVQKSSGEGRGLEPTMLFLAELWEEHTRLHVQSNQLSMPAGEAIIGVLILTDAVASELEGLTHLVIYTDSDVAAAALNTGASD